MRLHDLTGKVVGRWTVIEYVGNRRWRCRCACGNEKDVIATVLTSGRSNSCGCYRIEQGREHGAKINLRHGEGGNGRETPEYRAWVAMIQRCTNQSHKQFPNYGGRGIRVCDRWRNSFENFLQDMGRRPGGAYEYSLDRYPNNDGDYEPGNCRWATYVEQNSNKRGLHLVTIDGQQMTLHAALRGPASISSTRTFYDRVASGMTEEEALTTPPRGRTGEPLGSRGYGR